MLESDGEIVLEVNDRGQDRDAGNWWLALVAAVRPAISPSIAPCFSLGVFPGVSPGALPDVTVH